MLWFYSFCKEEEKNNHDFTRIMANVEMSTKRESHPKEPKNIEEGNIRDNKISVEYEWKWEWYAIWTPTNGKIFKRIIEKG